jgi:hypothetical protein
MPKINNVGPTFYGTEGLAVDGNQVIHQLDPSRNVDGSVVEGFESDERVIEDQDGAHGAVGEAPQVVNFEDPEHTDEHEREKGSGNFGGERERSGANGEGDTEKSDVKFSSKETDRTENGGEVPSSRGSSSTASRSSSAKTPDSKTNRR